MPLARARSSAHSFRVHSRAYFNRRACSSGIFTHFSAASGPGSSKLLRKLKHGGALLDKLSSGARKIYCKFTSRALHGNLKNLLSGLHVAGSNGSSSLYTGVNGSEKITAASVSKTPAPLFYRYNGAALNNAHFCPHRK